MKKKKVAFICVHNSCRSQIAEALGRHLAKEVFDSYSAGTVIKDEINPDAVRLVQQFYQIDMIEQGQYCKTIQQIPKMDFYISMGCQVACPLLNQDFDANWGLDDPSGKSDEEFILIIKEIEKKILLLKQQMTEEKSFQGYF